MLGGNISRLDRAIRGKMRRAGSRLLRTEVENYPEVDEAQFGQFLVNDDALLRASNAQWLLVKESEIDPEDIYFVKAGKVLSETPVQCGADSKVEVVKKGLDYFVRR